MDQTVARALAPRLTVIRGAVGHIRRAPDGRRGDATSPATVAVPRSALPTSGLAGGVIRALGSCHQLE